MDQQERRKYLIRALAKEDPRLSGINIPSSPEEQRLVLRGLMNIRPPRPADEGLLRIQDEYLSEELRQRGITDAGDLTPVRGRLCIWQGDITRLKCDAIVNAANSGMTGCYIPNHRCIDNCIHTFAGMQLRAECSRIMQEQGCPEPTGQAKITPGYNLPCRYVIHTVGPIITGKVTYRDRKLLASCYRSSLELADEMELESIAFCCISTGEFHFPNEEAARVAVKTVSGYLAEGSGIRRVIFNVFKDIDRRIYESLLG